MVSVICRKQMVLDIHLTDIEIMWYVNSDFKSLGHGINLNRLCCLLSCYQVFVIVTSS